MKSVHNPAMTRSVGRRFGARWRPRFRIIKLVFQEQRFCDHGTGTARAHHFRDGG